MPKSYSEKEKKEIQDKLKEEALLSLMQKGVKKTTVDELVQKVHIPKGTFYLFYSSKEQLLFEAINQKEKQYHQEMKDGITAMKDSITVEKVTDLLLKYYEAGFNMGILPIMLNGEFEILLRKLPDEMVQELVQSDEDFLQILVEIFPQVESDQIAVYAAAFRAIFLSASYQREIGEQFNDAIKMLIRGIVIQIMEEK